MRLLLRFDTGAGQPSPLRLKLADDATIGELADHLAIQVGRGEGLTIDGFCRTSLISDVGPLSGSIVRLTEFESVEHAAPAAPVRARFNIEASAMSGRRVELRYGSNDLGWFDLRVTEQVEVISKGLNRVLVNGRPVIGSCRVKDGDLVAVIDPPRTGASGAECTRTPAAGGWGNECCHSALAVEILGPLVPPVGGPRIPHRSAARIHEEFRPARISVPSPPEPARQPAMPVLSATVPLLLGAALLLATRSLASALFVLFSFVYVLAAGIEARREFRKEVAFREEQFHKNAERTLEAITESHAAESAFLDRVSPDPPTLEELLRGRQDRVWERCFTDTMGGALMVRIGTALRKGTTPVDRASQGRSDLLDPFNESLSRSERAHLAVTVDLDLGGGLGLIGTDEEITDLARWLVLQLAALNGPDQIRLVVACAREREPEWIWTAWLPHQNRVIDAHRTVVLVDGADEERVREKLAGIDPGTIRFIWLTTARANLPRQVRQSLDLRHGPRLVSASGNEDSTFVECEIDELVCDTVPTRFVTEAGPLLAPLAHANVLGPAVRDVDDMTVLSGVLASGLADDPLTIMAGWGVTAAQSGLSAPVARAATGIVELDLVVDGPHALIAGMTGSGKSELLRTWLLSMAIHHPPQKVTFLLVDYKGGAAFGPLESLPHTVGLITDLDEDLAHRAVVSLRAELVRRETWLAGIQAASMLEATGHPERPPSLVVVVDEFATLAREIPHFVDELVDVAQRGRSLGIHLVLATQRPHGVVSESIRANTSLRVALRVADPQDSIDVIDVPDASAIERNCPGSGIIAIGQARSGLIQFAYSSGPRISEYRVESQPLSLDPPQPGAIETEGFSEIEAAVDVIIRAFRTTGFAPPRVPWVAPLEDDVDLQSLLQRSGIAAETASGRSTELVLGLKDLPEFQIVEPFVIDLASSTGVVLFGGPRSGRSTAMATIATAAAHQLEDVLVYSVGCRVDHASDSMELSDHERVLRLLRGAAARCQHGVNRQRMVILIDDIGRFEQHYGDINRGEALRLLLQISRDGAAGCVNLVVGASRRVDLDQALAVGFGCQIHLRVVSEDEAAILGVPATLAHALPPGRGMHDGHWIQFARRTTGPCDRTLRSSPIPALPDVIDITDVLRRRVPTSEWRIPIGLDTDSLEVACLDLSHSHALVAGPRRSGRSSTLATIAASLRHHHVSQWGSATPDPSSAAVPFRALVIGPDGTADRSSDDLSWDHRITVSDLDTVLRTIRAGLESGGSVLVAFEEIPELLDSDDGQDIEACLGELLSLSRRYPIRVVVSGEIEAMTRCYSTSLSQVRSGRNGVLLRPDTDTHGSLLGCDLARRDELRNRAGQGWLVHNGDTQPIQVAFNSRGDAGQALNGTA